MVLMPYAETEIPTIKLDALGVTRAYIRPNGHISLFQGFDDRKTDCINLTPGQLRVLFEKGAKTSPPPDGEAMRADQI